jgi:hypothetical protein
MNMGVCDCVFSVFVSSGGPIALSEFNGLPNVT